MTLDDLCCGDSLHCQYPTFQILTKGFPRYKLSKIGWVSSLFILFLSFSIRLGMKVTNKWKLVIRLPWNWYTERRCKGASWYQVWLEYDKHSQNYLRLFTKKNNLHPQSKLCMARTSHNLWFKKNRTKDHKNTAKKYQDVIIMWFKTKIKINATPTGQTV